MPMYALGVVPLIQQLAEIKVWYADDTSAGGTSVVCVAGGMSFPVYTLTRLFSKSN